LTERVILYLHGGAYHAGSIKSHRFLAANIANAAKARALIIDYRLAPEAPFPAAVEDAQAAYLWLLANDVAPGNIVVAGDSAGGGLALAMLVALRDSGEPLPAAVVCLSPWVDLAGTGEYCARRVKADLIVDPTMGLKSAEMYLRDADPRAPLASPVYANLGGLPAMLVQVAADELLLSDSVRLAERARADGVKVTLEIWEGMQHVWQLVASFLPEGQQAVDRIGEFIRQL
jgi:acetyl esterase/lipase